jgi:phage-related baseplate assembly protein
MMNKVLNPAQQSELTFLRNQVDGRMNASLTLYPHSNTAQDLDRARRELQTFVETLRRDGYDI